MENDPNQPPKLEESESRIGFLFLAFSPIAIICLAIPAGFHPSSNAMSWILYGVNPVMSVFACMKMFDRPSTDSVTKIGGGIVFGLGIAVINFFVGILAGCACSGGLK